DDDEDGGAVAPRLVSREEEVEVRVPVLALAAGVEEAPLLLVEGRRRPACGLEKLLELARRERLARHRSRRPAAEEDRLDRVIGLPVIERIGKIRHATTPSRAA